jgi:hypothetical protein
VRARRCPSTERSVHPSLAVTLTLALALASARLQAAEPSLAACSAPPEFASAARTAPSRVRLVIGVPYSAQGVSETVTLRADGHRVVHQNTFRLWRDSNGRTRSEYVITSIAGPLPLELNATLTVIDDPAARQRVVLRDADRTAVTLPIAPCRLDEGSPATATGATAPVLLGERQVEGQTVAGSRIETTIPAGAVGNERPLRLSAEQWYGKELQVVVQATYRDPRTGETNYRLRRIRRSEPDAELFRIPEGYAQRPAPGEIRSWADRGR